MITLLDQSAWFIGTMGFSYKDWDDVFYPSGSSPNDYLAYYSRVFNSVEIDSTFYGTPRKRTVERWKQSTPDGFRFCLKMPRLITHDSGLTNVHGLVQEFIDSACLLDKKLGAVLIQFPPSFTIDQLDRLEAFCTRLPVDICFAVEFRDQSWYTASSQIANMLGENNVCWAATEYPGLPAIIQRTSSFIYVRWIGQHGAFRQHTYERIDRSREIDGWIEEILHNHNAAEAIYGFFNNDFAGFAAGTAIRFCTKAGLPVQVPKRPIQGKLL